LVSTGVGIGYTTAPNPACSMRANGCEPLILAGPPPDRVPERHAEISAP